MKFKYILIVALISLVVSFGVVFFSQKSPLLGATILSTALSDTIGTFRTNVNTSLSNLNTAIGSVSATVVSTSSPLSVSQILYATSANTMAGVATSTLTPSAPLEGSFIQIGSGGTITCATCLTSISLTGDVTGSGGSSIATNFAHSISHWWTALQNFGNASTSQFTATSTVWFTSLGTPAGAFLAVDTAGKVIATTTPSGGGGTSFPTYQKLTSTATSTYTTPASVTELHIRMVAGGGGGGGFSGCSNDGLPGTNSLFGSLTSSATTTANGGLGGTHANAAPGAGDGGTGGVTNLGTQIFRSSSGGGISIGGTSPFGGSGKGNYSATAGNASANTGSGGGSPVATNALTGGGGAGEYVEFRITSPAASYGYAVGAKGAGATGCSFNGGDGADGMILVEEFYH